MEAAPQAKIDTATKCLAKPLGASLEKRPSARQDASDAQTGMGTKKAAICPVKKYGRNKSKG
jgi:hypothetical protein